MDRFAFTRALRLACVVASLAAAVQHSAVAQQIKAFPQAEGFGAHALGGRGGDVYHVTNLNNSGAGSLRYGIENAPSSGRTIVFDLGGWINITSKLGVDTHIHNLTIAGQTAPGGIGVRGAQFSIGGDDVIVRHMRFRPGKSAGSDNDSINTNNNAQRVIYDHISAEFSTDGGFDNQATDVTLQFSSVSYGLQTHSTGSLLENPHNLSLHHNLYAHNNTRNPKHRVYTLDWVNNVIYNWDSRAVELQGTSDASYQWTANIDGNYFIAGPNHGGVKPLSGGSIQNYETWWGTNAYDDDRDSDHDGKDYSFGVRDFSIVSSAATRWKNLTGDPSPFPVTDEVWKDASTDAAYERVLSEFGATPWARDEVDQVLHDSVVNRNGSIITRESDLVPLGVSNGGFGTLGRVAAPTDADQDGMPAEWEEKIGTSDTLVNNNADYDDDGYTDLEEYLNYLAAFKAAGPLELEQSGRYAQWQNWTRRWEPSRTDEVHINNGTATVDAVGQWAGTLRVGADAGDDGTLAITAGWLEVTDDLEVGSGDGNTGGTGTVAHSGGKVTVLSGGIHIENGSYQLSGGTLNTPELSKGTGGSFEFTGGELNTDVVAFNLENSGGRLAPGSSIGQTHVQGDLTLTDGILEIELASESSADKLIVDGQVMLGGALDVQELDGFSPEEGSWEIISAGGFSGNFASITDGYSVQQQGNSLMLLVGQTLPLVGDYNGNGVVDAADYTVWRENVGTDNRLPNDPLGGTIGQQQYDQWRNNFGATNSVGAAASVPEPACAQLVLFYFPGAVIFSWRNRRRCSGSSEILSPHLQHRLQ